MKLKVLITLGLLTTASLFAQTTMCFKENHTDLTTLETVKLNGGECASKYSLTQMKEAGWSVDDIKINNNNYIYILKRGKTNTSFAATNSNSNLSEAELEKRVLAKLEAKKENEKKEKEIERKIKSGQNGKDIYVNKCQVCHGQKGLEKPGMSSKIAEQSFEAFQGSIQGYRNGTYDLGTSVQMSSYAYAVSENDIKDIYNYLQSLK